MGRGGSRGGNHGNSVITETDYELDGLFSIPGRGFSLVYSAHTGSGSPPSFLSNGYRGALSLEAKRPGPEGDRSPSSSTEDKNGGAILPVPHVFMA
jgi:hypothetical protein